MRELEARRRDRLSPAGRDLSARSRVRLYVRRQADSTLRYWWEQGIQALVGWVPTLVGIGLRNALYRLILRADGACAIERGVRLSFAGRIRLGRGCYLDERVYVHATPGGVEIGDGTLVMYGAVLHVYNFRDLPAAGIRIGSDSLIGEYSVLRGQGGISLGDRVYTSPMTQILAVDHVVDDPDRSFVEQGIRARGIVIEDDVWLGAGAIVTDGVKIGRGAVVGAGAVVTRDVAPHTVVAGNPARVVRDLRGEEDREAARARVAEVYP